MFSCLKNLSDKVYIPVCVSVRHPLRSQTCRTCLDVEAGIKCRFCGLLFSAFSPYHIGHFTLVGLKVDDIVSLLLWLLTLTAIVLSSASLFVWWGFLLLFFRFDLGWFGFIWRFSSLKKKLSFLSDRYKRSNSTLKDSVLKCPLAFTSIFFNQFHQ